MIQIKVKEWYNVREHNEPSGCEADIWRMCANHDEAKHNYGIITLFENMWQPGCRICGRGAGNGNGAQGRIF